MTKLLLAFCRALGAPSPRSAAAVIVAVFASACGGGSGGNVPAPPPELPGPAQPPFGLTERVALAPLTLGVANGDGALRIERRFPQLEFEQPLFVKALPDRAAYALLEQGGRIWRFAADETNDQATIALDLSDRVLFAGEQGLLGLAFDPDFAVNRHIYLHYSADGPRRSVIARFTWPDSAAAIDAASELVLLEVAQPFSNHNAGSLDFGPDGMLYIAMGDGGSGGDPGNRAQDTSELLGSILRIDVSGASGAEPYRIPADNPLVGQPPAREEIWARGLRNPFRFSFDPVSGELWVGDVGQSSREEINRIERGGNYGWRVLEGNEPFDDSENTLPPSAFTPPVAELTRDQARSITGGFVYRGTALPALAGRYLFGDFATGALWEMARVTGAFSPIGSMENPAFLGPDLDGEALFVSYGGTLHGLTEEGGTVSLPTLLSDTGVFLDTASLSPADGVVEYGVNESFWSQGASKRRWFALPDSDRIGFDRSEPWTFPVGSVFVKQFEIDALNEPGKRLELRLLFRNAAGWQAASYLWRADGGDAELLTAAALVDLQRTDGAEQTYRVPAPGECFGCHNAAAGVVLGANTAQFNRDFDYAGVTDNQLRALDNVSYFDADLAAPDSYAAQVSSTDADAPLEARVRSYLAANCGSCHRPGGPTGVEIDLTLDADLDALRVAPTAGDLGIADAQIVAPGAPQRSVLLQRVLADGTSRMPPLGDAAVAVRRDLEGAALLESWIGSL
ncbi:MAG: PQQ-dependent sugar dehydrogenase [Pseudomonadota bacterium]